jgi:predicted dehydrogenase
MERSPALKVLAVGGGSMGQRRLRDLLALSVGDVILFELQPERCAKIAAKFGIRSFTDFEQALAENPDVMTVSTPPTFHDLYVKQAMERKMHVFAELPFVYNEEVMERVAAQAKDYPAVLGISHTLRYYPPYRLIHDLLRAGKIGRPLYLEYSLGNYLPDWHPYEDYRKFYASDSRLGGAGLDMLLHELAAIQWWLGPVESVFARFSKLSDLEIKGPDNHDILLAFESGTQGYFHHDILEQGTQGRHIRIVGDAGTVEWHQNQTEVRLYDSATGRARNVPFSEAADWKEALEASRWMRAILAQTQAEGDYVPGGESAPQYTYESNYLREMRHFLEAAQGEAPYTMVNVFEELQNVHTFHAILRSAKEGREVGLNRQRHKDTER